VAPVDATELLRIGKHAAIEGLARTGHPPLNRLADAAPGMLDKARDLLSQRP
jgi:hypothetical protein